MAANPDIKQGTSLITKVLASGQVASATTDTTILTVGTGRAAAADGSTSAAVKLATFSLHNPTSAAVVINKVSIIPSGGTADGTHQQLTNYSLAAYDTISSEDVLSWAKEAGLGAGDYLVLNVAAAASINYLVTGTVSS